LPRLTITPPVIAAARRVAVIVAGVAKAPVVARALQGPWRPEELPAQLARHGTWILDRPAASALA
jgi:6-phosphogluconolactonase/glucosamine-6-phosphate isomerase/deaminase